MSTPSSPGAARPNQSQRRRVMDRAEQAIAALNVEIPTVETPPAYRFAMGLLVAWLIVITLVYASVVGFFGYLFGWHVYQAFNSFAVFHILMGVVGGLLLLFLIKPLFLRRKGKDAAVIVLTRADELKLFTFVNKLCEAMGCPMPDAIEVDCEPNAGARLNGIVGGGVTLRIGLPLVAALNARQFAGVLAHEFGHFSQRGGMRASTLVRILSNLFARIVFQRDRMDAALYKLRLYPHRLPRVLYRIAVTLIESARGILWLLLVLSEFFTCGALRRMEYDADCREAHVAGTKDFIVTGKLLAFLQIAVRRARQDLAQAWDQQRLADNFPRLVVANAVQLAEHRAGVIKALEGMTTGWLDTHPSHADRVRNIEQLGAAGVVKTDATAKSLFSDFDAVCRVATRTFYRGILGEEMTTATLVPTSELVGQRHEDRQAFRALQRFFQGRVIPLRPIFPDPDAVIEPENAGDTAAVLADSRELMVYTATEVAIAARDFEKSGLLSLVYHAQLALFGLFNASNAKIIKLKRRASKELTRHEPKFLKAVHQLPPFETAARDRLTSAIRLLWTLEPAALGKTPAEMVAARQSVAELVAICGPLHAALPIVSRLRDLTIRLRVFGGAYNPQQPFQPLVNHLLGAGRSAIDQLVKLRDILTPYPYPFEHPTPGVSIGLAIVDKMPNYQDPNMTHAIVSAALDRFYNLTYRTLARLTDWAEKVESSLGFLPLEEPQDEEDKETKEEQASEGRRNSRQYWVGYGGRALGGIALIWALVWVSVSPPSFGNLLPGDRGTSGEVDRPAPFHVPFQREAPRMQNRDAWTPPQQDWSPGAPTPYIPGRFTPHHSWDSVGGPKSGKH